MFNPRPILLPEYIVQLHRNESLLFGAKQKQTIFAQLK